MESAGQTRRRHRRLMVVAALLIVVGLPTLWFVTTYRWRQVVRRIEALNGQAGATHAIGLPFHGGFVNYGELDQVYLVGPQTVDGELRVLRGVPALRNLSLLNTRVSDEGLAELGRYPNLDYLCIGNIDYVKLLGPSGEWLQTKPLITGKGLEQLKVLRNLQTIELHGSSITDEDLQSLIHLTNLVLLDLRETKVTTSGVAKFKKAVPNCKVMVR